MKCAPILAPVATLCLLVGCGGLSANVTEETDPYSEEESYSRSVSIGTRDLFEEADALEMRRDFEGAIAIYRNIYQTSPEDETKARALLEWARTERSAFNPDRDPDAAAARLRLLLDDYADTEVAPEAAELLGQDD
jgi:hypothetical protein